MPRSNITHRWDTTKLTEAWTHDVQAEAASRVKELFPNLVQGNTLMPHWGRATAVSSSHDEAPDTEDDDASWGGLPFLQPPDGMAKEPHDAQTDRQFCNGDRTITGRRGGRR